MATKWHSVDRVKTHDPRMDRLDSQTQNLDKPKHGVGQSRETAELSGHYVDATVVMDVEWQPRSYAEARKIALLALLFALDLDADQPLRASQSFVAS